MRSRSTGQTKNRLRNKPLTYSSHDLGFASFLKIELRLSLELIYVSRADSTVGVISAKFRITFASISKVLFLLKLFRGYFLFLLPFFRKEYFSNHLSAVLQNLYELSLHMKKNPIMLRDTLTLLKILSLQKCRQRS